MDPKIDFFLCLRFVTFFLFKPGFLLDSLR